MRTLFIFIAAGIFVLIGAFAMDVRDGVAALVSFLLPFRNCVPVKNKPINIHCKQQTYIL